MKPQSIVGQYLRHYWTLDIHITSHEFLNNFPLLKQCVRQFLDTYMLRRPGFRPKPPPADWFQRCAPGSGASSFRCLPTD